MNNSVSSFLDDQPDMNDSDILNNIPRASPPITYDETEMPVKGTGGKKGAPTKDDRKLLEELLPSPAGFVISHIEHGAAVYIGRYTFDDVRSKGSIEMWIADNFRDQYGGGEYHVFPIEPKTGKPGEIPRVYKIAHTNSGPQVNENAMASVLNKTLEMIGTKEPRVERTVERVERAPAPMPAPVQNPVEMLRDTHNLLKEMNPGVVAKPEDNSIAGMMIQMQLQSQKMQHEREQAALDREAKREAAAQATQIAMAHAAAQTVAQKPSGPDPILAATLEKLNRLEQIAMMPPPPTAPPAPTGFDFAALLTSPLLGSLIQKFMEPKPDNTEAILQAMQASSQQQAELARAASERQAEMQRQAQKEQFDAQLRAAERQERIQREEQARQDALALAAQARHEALILSLKPKEDSFSLKDLLAMQKADADRAFAIQKENSDRTIAMLSNPSKNNTSFLEEVARLNDVKSAIEQLSPPSENAPETKDSTLELLKHLTPVLNQALVTAQKYLEKRPVQTVMMPAPRQQLTPNPVLQQGQPVQTQGLQNVPVTQVQPTTQAQAVIIDEDLFESVQEEVEMTTDQKVTKSLLAIQAAKTDKERIDATVEIFQSNMGDPTLGPTALLLGKFIIQNRDNQAANLVGNFLGQVGVPSGLITQETVEATAQAMFLHWKEIRQGLRDQVPFADMLLGEGKILKIRESDEEPTPAQVPSSEDEEEVEGEGEEADDDDDDDESEEESEGDSEKA